MTTAEDRGRARLELVACLGPFCTGVYSTAFGPALQILAEEAAGRSRVRQPASR